MQVTKKSIEETAGTDCRDWFIETFGEDAEVDAYIVVEKLREQKNTEDWMFWLFRKYELSGLYESFYSDGSTRARSNYKDGLADGLFEIFNLDGSLASRSNYKDGKIVGA